MFSHITLILSSLNECVVKNAHLNTIKEMQIIINNAPWEGLFWGVCDGWMLLINGSSAEIPHISFQFQIQAFVERLSALEVINLLLQLTYTLTR